MKTCSKTRVNSAVTLQEIGCHGINRKVKAIPLLTLHYSDTTGLRRSKRVKGHLTKGSTKPTTADMLRTFTHETSTQTTSHGSPSHNYDTTTMTITRKTSAPTCKSATQTVTCGLQQLFDSHTVNKEVTANAAMAAPEGCKITREPISDNIHFNDTISILLLWAELCNNPEAPLPFQHLEDVSFMNRWFDMDCINKLDDDKCLLLPQQLEDIVSNAHLPPIHIKDDIFLHLWETMVKLKETGRWSLDKPVLTKEDLKFLAKPHIAGQNRQLISDDDNRSADNCVKANNLRPVNKDSDSSVNKTANTVGSMLRLPKKLGVFKPAEVRVDSLCCYEDTSPNSVNNCMAAFPDSWKGITHLHRDHHPDTTPPTLDNIRLTFTAAPLTKQQKRRFNVCWDESQPAVPGHCFHRSEYCSNCKTRKVTLDRLADRLQAVQRHVCAPKDKGQYYHYGSGSKDIVRYSSMSPCISCEKMMRCILFDCMKELVPKLLFSRNPDYKMVDTYEVLIYQWPKHMVVCEEIMNIVDSVAWILPNSYMRDRFYDKPTTLDVRPTLCFDCVDQWLICRQCIVCTGTQRQLVIYDTKVDLWLVNRRFDLWLATQSTCLQMSANIIMKENMAWLSKNLQ